MSPRFTGIRLLSAFAFASLLAVVGLARHARADGAPAFDGPWNMTAVNETFTVQQWSNACGPAPVSGTSQPGGVVRVRSDGAELAIEGGRRTLRTDGCLDGMPTLASEAHSTDGKSWRTRCSTPASDPRRATINTAYFLTSDDTIQIAETGRYELTINSARCIADVKRDASLKRFATVAAAPSAVPAPSGLAVERARLPSTLLPPERPARLRSLPPPPRDPTAAPRVPRPASRCVRRESSCGSATPSGSARWSSTPQGASPAPPSSGPSARCTSRTGNPTRRPLRSRAAASSRCRATAQTPPFDVVATAAGRSAHASVEVTSPATYEALLAQSGLGPTGEQDEPAVAILATGSIGASDVHAEDGARQRRTISILVVATLAVGLGLVAAVGALRSRKARAVEQAAESRHADRMREYERQKRQREEAHAAQLHAHLESVANAQRAAESAAARGVDSGPTFCPSCRREFSGGGAFCPFDSNRLVAIEGHQDLMVGPSGGICPTCRRGFNPGIKVCPHDGDELVPPGMITAAVAAPAITRGKICPTCGGRFDGTAGFCGKDGTQLVLLN